MSRPPTLEAPDLHAFVDGELDGARYREVVAALADSGEMTAQVNAYLQQNAALATLRADLALAPGEERTDELAAAIAAHLSSQRRLRWKSVAAVAAAAVLVAGVRAWHLLVPEAAEPARVEALSLPEMPLQSLPGAGRPEPALAALGTGEAAVLWLNEYLGGRTLHRPDLEPFGLAFVGGDVLQHAERPAIRLVYEDPAGRELQLLIGVAPAGRGGPPTVVPDGQVASSWRRGGLVATLLAPADSPWLHDAVEVVGTLIDPASAAADLAAVAHGPAPVPLEGGIEDAPTLPSNAPPPEKTGPVDNLRLVDQEPERTL